VATGGHHGVHARFSDTGFGHRKFPYRRAAFSADTQLAHDPGNGTDATGIGRQATTMQRRFLLILVCASVLGLLASALVYRVVSQIASAGSGQYEPIVVAAVNMSLAETITSQHVKLVPWPRTSGPEGSVRTVQEAEG